MLKYKRIGSLLFLYTVVVGLYSVFQEEQYVTVDIFYRNIIFFGILVFLYHYELAEAGAVKLKLYRYADAEAFVEEKCMSFTISNLILSLGSFFIHYVLVLLFGNGRPQFGLAILYPIHIFIIFEIVGLFVISGIAKPAYQKRAFIGSIAIVAMYMVAMGVQKGVFIPILPFSAFFNGVFNFQTICLYVAWIAIFLVYYFRKSKAVEI